MYVCEIEARGEGEERRRMESNYVIEESKKESKRGVSERRK